jgi:hypothetical protein
MNDEQLLPKQRILKDELPVLSENTNERLRGLSVVVTQHSAKSLFAPDSANHTTKLRPWSAELPFQSLMVPFPVDTAANIVSS